MTGVLAIGAKARTALEASGREARPLATFPDAPYFQAGREIVWVGSRLPAMHPRAVVTAEPVARGVIARFGALPDATWSPALPPNGREVAAGCRRLRADLSSFGVPRGFGALLAGELPPFPLDLAVARVHGLASAYRDGDPPAVYQASRALLGLGGGLTPSGDDLAGGALFGRILVAADAAPWRAIGERLAADAQHASHAISAALLADLVAGASFAPLHALADALAAGDDAAASEAARSLVALGHSSGWDMLVGLVLGVTGAMTDEGGR